MTWNNSGNWQKRVGGLWVAAPDYPGQNSGAGIVWIQAGTTVNLNINPANTTGGITFVAGTTSVLNITTFILNISGAIVYSVPSNNNNQIINVSIGTLTCGSITMQVLANNRTNQLNISSGTVSVSGSITTNTAAKNSITFSGAGTLNVGGDFTGAGTFNCNSSIVNYNGNSGTQAVGPYVYYNLNFINGLHELLRDQ